MHNLFFALWPDEATRARLAAAAESLRPIAPDGRWIKPPRYHLTLQFLGEHAALPQPLVERAIRAAARVRAPAFDLALDVAGSFVKPRIPCWLGCSEVPPELPQLFDALAAVLREHRCVVIGAPSLTPHVTVLRGAEHAFAARLDAVVHWPVNEFVLIDSRMHPPAPYRLLGRWSLA